MVEDLFGEIPVTKDDIEKWMGLSNKPIEGAVLISRMNTKKI